MCDLKCCANCKYWYCYDNEKDKMLSCGECRRFPPNVPIFDSNGDSDINLNKTKLCTIRGTAMMCCPFTYADEWCGEFSFDENAQAFDYDYFDELK